jgi:hypothetical protein
MKGEIEMSNNENEKKPYKKLFIILGFVTILIPFIIFAMVYGIG